MLLKIDLMKSPNCGCYAVIEANDGETFTIAGSHNAEAKTVCLNAAKFLLTLSYRFSELATMPDPYDKKILKRINHKGLKKFDKAIQLKE